MFAIFLQIIEFFYYTLNLVHKINAIFQCAPSLRVMKANLNSIQTIIRLYLSFILQIAKIENHFLQYQTLLMLASIKFMLLMIAITSAQLYGSDQMPNSNFMDPPLGNFMKLKFTNISGWTCNRYCIRVQCEYNIIDDINDNTLFPHCSGVAIRLDAGLPNAGITQTVSLSTGTYLLSFSYYYPQQGANITVFNVYFNDQRLLTVRPNVQTAIEGFKYQGMVEARQGHNSLSFFNTKKQVSTLGFIVNNIQFRRILDQTFQRSVSNFFQLDFLTTSVSFPGGRVFFGSLMSFLINLDRYQLYEYHNRNYSYHSKRIMESLRNLQNKKGKLFSDIVDSVFSKYTSFVKEKMEKVNLKINYYKYGSVTKLQNEDNFNPIISEFFAYSLPIILFLYALLHILFHLLKKWAISKLLREFSFHATLIFVMVEGNIEVLTFHSFGQLKNLFSFSFDHKIFNILALIILFCVTFICFGLYLLLKISYNKKAKLILDSEDCTFQSLISVNFDRGIIIFLLGVTHQILIKEQTLQLSLLIFLQILWIIKRFFNKQVFKKTSLFILILLQSLLRIFFQTTCLAYSLSNQNVRASINSRQHKALFYVLIVFISAEILFIFALAIIKWYKKIKMNISRVSQEPQIISPPSKQTRPGQTAKLQRQSTKIEKICILKSKQRREQAEQPIKKSIQKRMRHFLNINRFLSQ